METVPKFSMLKREPCKFNNIPLGDVPIELIVQSKIFPFVTKKSIIPQYIERKEQCYIKDNTGKKNEVCFFRYQICVFMNPKTLGNG